MGWISVRNAALTGKGAKYEHNAHSSLIKILNLNVTLSLHCTGVKIGYFTINNSNESTLRAPVFTQWYFRDGGRVESWWKMEQVIIMSIAFWDSVDRLIDFLSVDKDQIQTFNITITLSVSYSSSWYWSKIWFYYFEGIVPWMGRTLDRVRDWLKSGLQDLTWRMLAHIFFSCSYEMIIILSNIRLYYEREKISKATKWQKKSSK